ncbi:ComF family protein, partial [Ralstonia pseudosolanacearum]|uniref:ComF family protein n=1 Tax=Ralstonia pseudosolanacearum TaxID=1310165 RepID=UPI003D17AA85
SRPHADRPSGRRRDRHAHQQPAAGRRIGVVDDVMTTGATLSEIATQLKRAGAARVTNCVALRTP